MLERINLDTTTTGNLRRYNELSVAIKQKLTPYLLRGSNNVSAADAYTILFLRPLFIVGSFSGVLWLNNYLVGDSERSSVYESTFQALEKGATFEEVCTMLKQDRYGDALPKDLYGDALFKDLYGDALPIINLPNYIILATISSTSLMYRELRLTITAMQLRGFLNSLDTHIVQNNENKAEQVVKEIKNLVVNSRKNKLFIHLLSFVLPAASIIASIIYAKSNGKEGMVGEICECNNENISELLNCVGPVTEEGYTWVIIMSSLFVSLSAAVGVIHDNTENLISNVKEVLEPQERSSIGPVANII
jgi:hypothetical protein